MVFHAVMKWKRISAVFLVSLWRSTQEKAVGGILEAVDETVKKALDEAEAAKEEEQRLPEATWVQFLADMRCTWMSLSIPDALYQMLETLQLAHILPGPFSPLTAEQTLMLSIQWYILEAVMYTVKEEAGHHVPWWLLCVCVCGLYGFSISIRVFLLKYRVTRDASSQSRHLVT